MKVEKKHITNGLVPQKFPFSLCIWKEKTVMTLKYLLHGFDYTSHSNSKHQINKAQQVKIRREDQNEFHN